MRASDAFSSARDHPLARPDCSKLHSDPFARSVHRLPEVNSMPKFTQLVLPYVTLLLFVMVAGPARATFPGSNGRIAFNRGDFFNGIPASIVTANSDGSDQHQVPLPK